MTESRIHERSVIHRANGKSLTAILCPFCGVTTEAYIWSLAGSGKRCDCGALHTFHPPITIKESR